MARAGRRRRRFDGDRDLTMEIRALRVENFRNYAFADLRFEGLRQFVVGLNGQGKTNLLEAIGMVTALRSFRTTEDSALIRWKCGADARVWLGIAHEREREVEVELGFGRAGKSVQVDGERVARFGDFIGRFPTVCFTAQDLQILRGAPALRRRFMDLVLSAVDHGYYESLRRYHGALRDRNRLLKDGRRRAEIEAFNAPMARAGIEVRARRSSGMEWYARVFAGIYRALSPAEEVPELIYRPAVTAEDEAGFLQLLRDNHERDVALQTSTVGPHRDDFSFRLLGHRAREFASEGQQRGLVLALRLAEARWCRDRTGIRPVILADDILGELDPQRRERFWQLLDADLQVFATGTRLPESGGGPEWSIWSVNEGNITRAGADGEGASEP